MHSLATLFPTSPPAFGLCSSGPLVPLLSAAACPGQLLGNEEGLDMRSSDSSSTGTACSSASGSPQPDTGGLLGAAAAAGALGPPPPVAAPAGAAASTGPEQQQQQQWQMHAAVAAASNLLFCGPDAIGLAAAAVPSSGAPSLTSSIGFSAPSGGSGSQLSLSNAQLGISPTGNGMSSAAGLSSACPDGPVGGASSGQLTPQPNWARAPAACPLQPRNQPYGSKQQRGGRPPAGGDGSGGGGIPVQEPPLAASLGVSIASLERLFRADGRHDYEQPVWMVVNLAGKIKGSYTAEKMIEFCKRGTLSARQMVLGIDRDLPYVLRQDLTVYRPLGVLAVEVHQGGRYVPLSAARAKGATPWAPVVPRDSSPAVGGATSAPAAAADGLATALGGVSLSGGGAAAPAGGGGAAAAGSAAAPPTAAASAALRVALQRLFTPNGPRAKGQAMWLYLNHLGWCRGPFSGGKLMHAHLCGRLPRDTLVVGYDPSVPVFMLSGDVSCWFRPLGALLDNVALGFSYNAVTWNALMQQAGAAPAGGAAPAWQPLSWRGAGPPPLMVRPEQLDPPTGTITSAPVQAMRTNRGDGPGSNGPGGNKGRGVGGPRALPQGGGAALQAGPPPLALPALHMHNAPPPQADAQQQQYFQQLGGFPPQQQAVAQQQPPLPQAPPQQQQPQQGFQQLQGFSPILLSNVGIEVLGPAPGGGAAPSGFLHQVPSAAMAAAAGPAVQYGAPFPAASAAGWAPMIQAGGGLQGVLPPGFQAAGAPDGLGAQSAGLRLDAGLAVFGAQGGGQFGGDGSSAAVGGWFTGP